MGLRGIEWAKLGYEGARKLCISYRFWISVGASIWHPRRMTRTAKRALRLLDSYCFPGFRPGQTVCGVFGDPKARVIRLNRRSKKRLAAVAVACRWAGEIARCGGGGGCRVGAHADFSRIGGAAPRLPSLWQGEARAARLSGGQSALHPALCLLCRPSLPIGDDQGRGGGIEAGLAHGQGAGPAVYGSAARACRHAFTAGDWH